MHPTQVANILNEYLSFMNKTYNLYSDRFQNKYRNENESIDADHLVNFRKMVYAAYFGEEYVPDDEFVEMLYFYTRLMHLVDKALDKIYIYDYEFSLEEGERIIDLSVINAGCERLLQNTINVNLPRTSFDLDNYKIYNRFPAKIEYIGSSDDDFIDIIFDNSDNVFTYIDLWDIKKYIMMPLNCFVDWLSITNENVRICFRDNILGI